MNLEERRYIAACQNLKAEKPVMTIDSSGHMVRPDSYRVDMAKIVIEKIIIEKIIGYALRVEGRPCQRGGTLTI